MRHIMVKWRAWRHTSAGVFGFVVLTRIALVHAESASPGGVPPTGRASAPTCAVGDGFFDETSQQIMVCDRDRTKCQAIDFSSKTLRAAAVPNLSAPSWQVSAANDKACDATSRSCITLPRRAQLAIRALRDQEIQEAAQTPVGDSASDTASDAPPMVTVEFSDDKAFALFYLTGREMFFKRRLAWNLRKDRAMKVKSWSRDPGMGLQLAEPSAFVGDKIIFSILPCAGPCMTSKLFDRKGKARSKEFDGVTSVVALDAKTWFAVSSYQYIIKFTANRAEVALALVPESERDPDRAAQVFVLQGAPYVVRSLNDALHVDRLSADLRAVVASVQFPFCP